MADAPVVFATVDVAAILDLRHRVLRPGCPFESARFEGDDVDTTRHYAALLDGEAVACLTLMSAAWEGRDAWQLRGMATSSRHRRVGIGTGLLRHALADLDGIACLWPMWCNARIAVIDFYRHLGWTVFSEPFDIPGIGPHVTMLRRD